jgi:hypothetical protein
LKNGNTRHNPKQHNESQVVVIGKWQYSARPKNDDKESFVIILEK